MTQFIDPAIVPKKKLYTGEQMPCIGMGTFGSDRVGAEEVSEAVAGALRCGYRLFDCAACYRNEDQIGQVFENALQKGLQSGKICLSCQRYGMTCTGMWRRRAGKVLRI